MKSIFQRVSTFIGIDIDMGDPCNMLKILLAAVLKYIIPIVPCRMYFRLLFAAFITRGGNNLRYVMQSARVCLKVTLNGVGHR